MPTTLPQNVLLSDLPTCNGMDGAKMFNTHPSSRTAVFDQNENFFYIITTDSRNVKTEIRRMSFEESPVPKPEDLYVSKEEFTRSNEELKGAIANVQYSIQQLIAATQEQTSSNNADERTNQGGRSTSKRNGSNARNNRGANANNGNVQANQ